MLFMPSLFNHRRLTPIGPSMMPQRFVVLLLILLALLNHRASASDFVLGTLPYPLLPVHRSRLSSFVYSIVAVLSTTTTSVPTSSLGDLDEGEGSLRCWRRVTAANKVNK